MAVSMITSYADSSGGGSSRLLDFSVPSSGDSGAAAPQMGASAMQARSDSFQSSAPAAYSPPPQAMPSPNGSFDFVA